MKKRPFLMLSGAFVFGEVCYIMAVRWGLRTRTVALLLLAAAACAACAAGRNGRGSGSRWLLWVMPFFVLAGMFRLEEAWAWSRLAASAMAEGKKLPVEIVCRVDEVRTDADTIQFHTRTILEMTEPDSGAPDSHKDQKTGNAKIKNEKTEDGRTDIFAVDCCHQEDCSTGALVVLRTADGQTVDFKSGDIVRGRGSFAAFESASNFGQFDFRAYYKAQGLEGRVTLDTWEIFPGKTLWWANGAWQIRQFLLARLSATAGEDAGLLSAIMTGWKNGLSDADKKLFQENGISHIYAVSGLHASFVGWGIYRLLQKLGGSRKLCSACACAALWLLMLMAGNGVSVRRAFLMFTLTLTAGLAGRTYDLPVGAAAAGLVILWERPLMLFQSGFQLSFCAVAGIVAAASLSGGKQEGERQAEQRYIRQENNKKQKIRTKTGKILSALTVSAWIQLVLLPATLWHFFQYPVYGVLLNLIVIPLLPVVLTLGFLSVAVSCLWQTGARLCLVPVHMIFDLWRFLCRTVRRLPGACIVTGRPEPVALVIFCLFLICFWLYSIRKNWGDKCWYPGCLFLALALSLSFLSREPASGLQVTFLDVGQGDGIYLREESGYTMMIDGGSSDVKQVGENRLLPMLKASGCSWVDDWFLSHPDQDHLSGLTELLAEGFPIKRLWIAGVFRTDETVGKLTDMAMENGTEIRFTHPGVLLSGPGNGSGFSLTCLAPEAGEMPSSANDGSMVLLAEYDGIRLLFPGDLEWAGETRLLAAYDKVLYDKAADEQAGYDLSCHILKVGHHGSKGSTGAAFLSAVNPLMAVISCGRDNRYGHPHPELLSRLETQHCRVNNTAEEGAVTVWIENGEIYVSGFCDGFCDEWKYD